jgi:hypothetical protein
VAMAPRANRCRRCCCCGLEVHTNGARAKKSEQKYREFSGKF